MFLMYLSIAVMIAIGLSEPLETKKLNRIEMFNEAFVMFAIYHLVIFTDFVPDIETKYLMGWSCIAVTSFNMLVNLTIVFIETMVDLHHKLKRWLKKKD